MQKIVNVNEQFIKDYTAIVHAALKHAGVEILQHVGRIDAALKQAPEHKAAPADPKPHAIKKQ